MSSVPPASLPVLVFCVFLGQAIPAAPVTDVPPGEHDDVLAVLNDAPADTPLRLTGDTTFGWKTDGLAGVIDLNGHPLTWDTGGGNVRTCHAKITGEGRLTWVGGGSTPATLNAPGWFGGSTANTFSGPLILSQGTMVLNKPQGTLAYGGDLFVIGQDSGNPAILRWGNSRQLAEHTKLVLTGPHPVILRPDGHAEHCGPLALETDAEIDLSSGAAELRFGASAEAAWTPGRQLIIRGWNANAEANDHLSFGNDRAGLAPTQLAQVGFMNPAGRPPGLYRAELGADGELMPTGTALSPTDPPFPFTSEAIAARRETYRSDGLESLANAVRSKTVPQRLAFFGDSITWQANGPGDPPETANLQNDFGDNHHYYDQIGQTILRAGGHSTKLFNDAINGGGVREIESGTEHSGDHAGKVLQPAFADLLEKNEIELAVLYVGVNDAWWRNTPPDQFEASLTRMVEAAGERDCRVVLATPLCLGERPDGRNPEDPALEAIVEAVRNVAATTGATLVDLRSVFLAWSRNHNAELKLDGSLSFREKGMLTDDRVHLTETGATLVANHIAEGIVRAIGDSEPPPPSPAVGLGLLPMPVSLTTGSGHLSLTASTRIVHADPETAPLATILAGEIETLTGFAPATAPPPAERGDLLLRLDPALEGEAYTLEIGHTAVVTAGTYPALASATTTLLQLVDAEAEVPRLPEVRIEDQPSYSYRAIMIDLARKYHSLDGIRQVIRLCRHYKIRYLHLHLTDDQLFMFPSEQFPEAGKSNREFARFEPPSKPDIQPYTRDELVALDQFAARHGVLLVPEIDLPGHSGRLIADVPEAFAFPGNGATVHIASPATLAAVETLLNEMMDVFQSSPFVHLGADEVNLAGLEETPEYRAALAEDPSLGSPRDVYHKFIGQMHDIVTARGRQSIVWEEAWTPSGPYPLPQDAIVMVWNQGRSPADIAASGHRLINTTWTPLYLVRDNKKSPEFLFDWNPTLFGREGSERFTHLSDASKLLGLQLTSWENSESIEIQGLRKRAAIVAERGWNAGAGGRFEDFRRRWEKTDAILDPLIHGVEMQVEGDFTRDEHTFRDSIAVTLAPREPGLTVRYTLDNRLPNPGWKTYDAPLLIRDEVHLRAGQFDRRGEQVGGLVGAWFRPDEQRR